MSIPSKGQPERTLDTISNANFPVDEQGRVYHLAVKKGEVANRVLSVGDPKRAQTIAGLLDDPKKTMIVQSKRGFIVYTGRKNNVPVSIIATGMGYPMMDFVVRETRAIVDGPMIFIRLGTCGTPRSDVKVGSLSVATPGSVFVRRDPDSFDPDSHSESHYHISKMVASDKQLTEHLCSKLKQFVQSGAIVEGANATADSFYSSQGRVNSDFDDHNATLVDTLASQNITTLEMETFHLLDLARCSKGSIKATATTIVLAQRKLNDFLDHATLVKLEKEGGEACLQTLSTFHMDGKTMDADPDCVWNKD